MKKLTYNIAIVGASGIIGRKFTETLEKRNFPVNSARLFASKKSEGKKVYAFGKQLTVETLENNDFKDIDFAFFSAGKEVSLNYAPLFAKSGALVIDNSSAFRMDEHTPLVVPEINADTVFASYGKIIANPNCSTIIALMPLVKIFKKIRIKRIIFTSYQAVSGSGMRGIKDLLRTRYGFSPEYYPVDISETILPKIGEKTANGYTEEEMKMVNETRKILNADFPISATCARVPVENCHGISVEVETENKIDITTLKKEMTFDAARYVEIPTCIETDGEFYVTFGRLRKSLAFENGFSYFVTGDNTLKGAALNAIQIAEYIISNAKKHSIIDL